MKHLNLEAVKDLHQYNNKRWMLVIRTNPIGNLEKSNLMTTEIQE